MAARLQRWRAELLALYDVTDLVGRTVTPAGCQLVTTILSLATGIRTSPPHEHSSALGNSPAAIAVTAPIGPDLVVMLTRPRSRPVGHNGEAGAQGTDPAAGEVPEIAFRAPAALLGDLRAGDLSPLPRLVPRSARWRPTELSRTWGDDTSATSSELLRKLRRLGATVTPARGKSLPRT